MQKRLLISSTAPNLMLDNKVLENSLISVTQNYATIADFENFLSLKKDKKFPVNMREDAYELWINKNLIGYCIFNFTFENATEYGGDLEFDDPELYKPFCKENAKTLFLDSNLELVYIVEKYQGMGLGSFFSSIINDVLIHNIFAHFNFNTNKKFNKLDITARAEYVSKGGEIFHLAIHQDIEDYVSNMLKSLFKVKIIFEYDAGY